MNKIESKFNIKTFIMFLTVLVLSLSMVFATACNKGDSSSESTSTSESKTSESESEQAIEDPQVLANGDFEHPSNKKAPITLSSSSSTYKWSSTLDGDSGFQLSSSTVTRAIIDVTNTQTDSKYQEKEGDTVINPGTPASADVEGTDANEGGKKILMLRNKEHSAQYVTSSTSLSVPAGEYGKVTVWVRTSQLVKLGENAGAYIKVKNNVSNPTVDGTSYDPIVIDGIDTAKIWTEYTIYLAPNQNKATTFTLVLGLGEGNSKNAEKHVEGFAYFDNVSFELIDKATYDAAVVEESVTVDTSADEYVLTNEGRVHNKKSVKFDLSESLVNSFNIGGVTPPAESKVTLVDNVLSFDFSGSEIGSTYTHVSDTIPMPANSYVRISFWAKIEAEDYQTKATMSVFDVVQDKDVISFSNVSTKGYENEHTDDFARYTFYVANNFAESIDFQIKITFGPTEDAIASTDIKALPTGTATFKGFETELLTKENYELVNISTDTRAQKGSLLGRFDSDFEEEEDEEEEDKDSYNVTVTGHGKDLLDAGEIVGLDHLSSSNLTQIADSATVGVVNSKNTYDGGAIDGALAAVQAKLDAQYGDHNKNVQALLVNGTANTYQVSGNIINLPKNSIFVFSINVYAHTNATAYVRLAEVIPSTSESKDKLPEYSTVITNAVSDKFETGFATVTFIIVTGYESYDVKLEFGANGVALFQSIVTGITNNTYSTADIVKQSFDSDDFKFAGDVLQAVKTYHYTSAEHAGDLELAVKDENNKPVYDESKTKEIASTYATLNSTNEALTGAKLVIYNRLNLNDRFTIDLPEGEESTSAVESESTTEEESAAEEGQNLGWLQVTSIIIALVLVAALVAVVVRKSVEGKNSKKKKTEKYYQGYDKSKRYTKNSDVAVPDEDDKSKDYDYDNPENN